MLKLNVVTTANSVVRSGALLGIYSILRERYRFAFLRFHHIT